MPNKTIYVKDIALWMQAARLARKRYVSMSELIHQLLDDYVHKELQIEKNNSVAKEIF